MFKSLKIMTAAILIATTFVQNANAQRPYFNKNKDVLMAQFDLKPDEDDVHSAAALACMLQHSDFDGVNYYAVAGAYGTQNGTFVNEALPGLYNLLFGQENVKWTNADKHWNTSVTWIKNKVKPYLNAGGKVFVQEAGQSDITYDWCNALISEGMSASLIKSNVVVVQHSDWNEDKSTNSKLNWVKANTHYYRIEDGNSSNNATPGFNSKDKKWLNNAIASSNPNSLARSYWSGAKQVCSDYDASWDNPTIAAGGVDFSDCVENWWIFNLSSSISNISSFWNRYVVNNDGGTTPVEQSPYGGSVRVIPGTIEAEEYDNGGEGLAYHDTTIGNSGPNVMREGEGVDIESRNGEINVGWTAANEWLEHTVNVSAGVYDIEANVATNSTGKAIALSLGGTNVGTINCPNTGDWGTFKTVKISGVNLAGGNSQVLRSTFVSGGVNLNWIKFTRTDGGSVPATVTLSPINDAYLQGSSAFNNTLIRVEANKRVGYLMYDLSSISGTITGAQLKLTCNGDSGSGTVEVNLGNGTAWTETSLSTSNAPSKGVLLTSINKNYSIGSVYSWDLDVSKLSTGGKVSLVVSQTAGNDFAMASKENSATEPQLVITYSSLKSATAIKTVTHQNGDTELSKPVIYPNPLNGGTLRINTNINNEEVVLRILDLKGKSIYQETTRNKNISINTDDFLPGIYLVQIKHKQNISTTKLLVK